MIILKVLGIIIAYFAFAVLIGHLLHKIEEKEEENL